MLLALLALFWLLAFGFELSPHAKRSAAANKTIQIFTNHLCRIPNSLPKHITSSPDARNASAQNLEVPFPTAASDGTTIQGSGTLYVFTGEFLERAEDATDPTGFDAIEFEIDGVCTP